MRARDNPFAVHRILEFRYQWSESQWATALQRLEQMGFHGAIVGPHGSGKTTLMDDLGQRLRDAGKLTWFCQLHTGERRLPIAVWKQLVALPTSTFLLLDGAEQLSYWRWRELVKFIRKSKRPFVVTLHRVGRWPTWFESRADIAILDEMVHEFLPSPPPNVSAINRHLFSKHNGNIREALREWYDLMSENSSNQNSSRFANHRESVSFAERKATIRKPLDV
jgi:hypothetical protein